MNNTIDKIMKCGLTPEQIDLLRSIWIVFNEESIKKLETKILKVCHLSEEFNPHKASQLYYDMERIFVRHYVATYFKFGFLSINISTAVSVYALLTWLPFHKRVWLSLLVFLELQYSKQSEEVYNQIRKKS